ncbi:GAF domain-containing protein [Halalkalibacterium halodurans]|uniref:sensor histidine kinase n=1 Tax=Halalkalibacterium halodurans TaxID=86665 RepID=UPI00106734E3|nr:GAF domain-containing protein [Halalkalibacterium halodurans]
MKSIKIDMSLDDIINNMIDKLKLLVHFDRISFLLLANETLKLSHVYPKGSYSLDIGSTIPKEQSLYWSTLDQRQTILRSLTDTQDNFYEKQYLAILDLKSILVIPIYSKNKRIGVLSIGRKQQIDWSLDDLAFLEQLTDHLAVSIENVELYGQVLRSKQEWEDTFKAVDDMIIVFDQKGNVIQFNDAVQHFLQSTKLTKISLLAEHCEPLVKETFKSQKAGHEEIHFRNQIICELSTYPLVNNEQVIYGVIAYIKDVTEKRKMEVQLIHSGKLAAIGEMAAGVAHELNSPLTAILGNSQLILRDVKDHDPLFPLLTDIKNCGNRCKRIINSLLTFSRQEEFVFKACAINDAVNETLNLLKYQLQKEEVVIKTDLQEDIPLIEGNQAQIEQIIINLLLNAKDALEEALSDKKEVLIKTWFQYNEVHLSVTDNGIGIEEERLAEIFHPFHTTKSSKEGTGLGLSVSIGIAKSHGGTIDVHSKLKKGSTFILRLPAASTKIGGAV